MRLVDIVIPVYNAEKKVLDLLNCLEKQSNNKFNLIFVNDGSKDRTLDVLREFKLKSNINTNIVNIDNKGPSNARNIGLENANCEYIIFLDADDIIPENFVQELLKSIESNENIDLVVCSMEWITEKKSRLIETNNILYELNPQNIDLIDQLLEKQLLNSVNNKIYKKNIIDKNNLKFDVEMEMGEDLNFNLKYLELVNCILEVPHTKYIYQTDNSFLTNKIRENEFKNRKKNILLLKAIFEKYSFEKDTDFFLVKIFYAEILQHIKRGKKRTEILESISVLLLDKDLKDIKKTKGKLQSILTYPVIKKNKRMILFFSIVIFFIKKNNRITWKNASV